MSSKSANCDMENDFFLNQKCPLKKIIFSGNWKLEKTLCGHQNNTAIRMDYFTLKKKKKNHFKTIFLNKMHFSAVGGQTPLSLPRLADCPAKKKVF